MKMWGVIATWYFALDGVKDSAALLKDGAPAMDAVMKIATGIEENPEIDSVGLGGFPNLNGELELDAAVMDGTTLNIGAVCGLKRCLHPILVARDVLYKTRHNVLIGEGAEAFARAQGYGPVELVTPAARKKWEQEKAKLDPALKGHDTVGVIALDANGRMSAGTSTSGAGMKLPGRVGDSPLVGSGFYVDDDCGGAAATGWGEDIMKGCASYAAVELMRAGCTAQEAAEKAVARTHLRLARGGVNPGNIAIVCMDNKGHFGGAANHEGFMYAAASETTAPRLYELKPLVLRESSGSKQETINNIYE